MEGTLRETAVLVLREQPKGHAQVPPSRRPSFDFGTSFEASFLAEQCSAATSEGTCPLPEDLFPDVTDSDNVPSFDFSQERQGGALSLSTGSEAFTMQSLSTNGSSSDDLDELLTWLDKDVPLLGFRPSDVGVSPLRGAAAEQQEVTSPVPRSFDTVLEARPRFADPPPRKEAPLPLLRIRIKSQAWTRPVIVVAEPPGAAFKKPFVAGHSVRTFPPVKTGPQAGRSQRSPSLDLNGLQSCGSTKSFQFAVPGPTQGFGAVGNEGGSVFKKRRAGGRHKRKDAWPGKPFQEPMLTNPLVATFTSEGGSPLEGLNTEDGVAGFSGREFGESGAGEAAAQVGEESEAEFVDNISRRPGLRVVRRRVHVAPEEDGEGGEGESPGRQAKWKRKAPRAPQAHRKVFVIPPAIADQAPTSASVLA